MEFGSKEDKSLEGFKKTESHAPAGVKLILIKSIKKVDETIQARTNDRLHKETG